MYASAPGKLGSLLSPPEWCLAGLVLGGLCLFTAGWHQLLIAILFVILAIVPIVSIGKSVAAAPFVNDKLRYRVLTGMMHILQPVARISGRLSHALACAKTQGLLQWTGLGDRVLRIWSEQWRAPEEWLTSLETRLKAEDVATRRGGNFDSWDFEAQAGLAGGVRLKMAIEEHGAGEQMLNLHLSTRVTGLAVAALFLFGVLSAAAFFSQNLWFGAAFGTGALMVLLRVITECSVAVLTAQRSIESLSREERRTNEGVGGVVYLGCS